MVFAKKIGLRNIFIFLFLAIFPFGQIIRIGILQPIDIIVGFAAVYTILAKLEKPRLFKYLENFLIVAGFSWLLSAAVFRQIQVFYGFLYLIRLAAYLYFVVYVWNFVKSKARNKDLVLGSLLTVSLVSAVFGWIQYFVLPSIRPFFVWGWDEHFLRLVGTFLDPGFLGLILVFGCLITMYRFMEAGQKKYLFGTAFLILSLAFTYSRASYLAFFAGFLVILFFYKKLKYFLFIVLGFLGIMLSLPTSRNHVLSFTREFSAVARVASYADTINIFETSPVFGVGYDNLCLARSKELGYIDFQSHACSGSDSSLLFVLAATGILGLITFIWTVFKSLVFTKYHILYTSSLAALSIHSLFTNSMFYPWIMGYIILIFAVSLRSEVES